MVTAHAHSLSLGAIQLVSLSLPWVVYRVGGGRAGGVFLVTWLQSVFAPWHGSSRSSRPFRRSSGHINVPLTLSLLDHYYYALRDMVLAADRSRISLFSGDLCFSTISYVVIGSN